MHIIKINNPLLINNLKTDNILILFCILSNKLVKISFVIFLLLCIKYTPKVKVPIKEIILPKYLL